MELLIMKKSLIFCALSGALLTACNNGHGGGTSSGAVSATRDVQEMTYAQFLQRVDPKTGKVTVPAKSALALHSNSGMPVSLGSAAFTDNGYVMTGSTCLEDLDNVKVELANRTGSLTFSKNLTSEQIKDSLGINGSIQGSVGAFKGSVQGSYVDETSSDATSLTYNFISQVKGDATLLNRYNSLVNGTTQVQGMQSHKDELAANNADSTMDFYYGCGDKYVAQVPSGAYIATTVKLSFKSETDKQAFNAAMSASIESIGSISAAVDYYKGKTGKSEDVNVYAVQVGGNPERLATIFTDYNGKVESGNAYNSYSILNCGASNMQACTNVIGATMKYASSDFINQIVDSEGKYVNMVQYGDPTVMGAYSSIGGYSKADRLMDTYVARGGSASQAGAQLIAMKEVDDHMLNYIKDYLSAGSLTNSLSSELKGIEIIFNNRTNYYKTNADKIIGACFSPSATMEDDTSCSKQLQNLQTKRLNENGYKLSTEQLDTLKYLDSKGFLDGTSISTSTYVTLYPTNSATETPSYGISSLMDLAPKLEGFTQAINVDTSNDQLKFSGILSSGTKKITISTATGCAKLSNNYICNSVRFTLNGFSEEEKTAYTDLLNKAFNTQWSAGKNWYLRNGYTQ